jgi:adenine-specific DNA-methyltransferase
MPKYARLARDRIQLELEGVLRTRPMNRPVYEPRAAGNWLTVPPWAESRRQPRLFN